MFIHYGTKSFNRDFEYPADEDVAMWSYDYNKPYACLWGSLRSGEHSWKKFIEGSSIKGFKNLRKFFMFDLEDDSKVLTINKKTIRKVFKKYGYTKVRYSDIYGKDIVTKMLFWEGIARDFDAVYVDVTSLGQGRLHSLVDEYNLANFDVNSICVWNLKRVKVL